MSGYCSTGRVARPINPARSMIMEMTDDSIGLSMNVLSVIKLPP